MDDADGDADESAPRHAIDSQTFMVTAAKASIPPPRLSELLATVQTHLAGERDVYRRSYERVDETTEREVFLVATDHWQGVGDELGLTRREADALRRAHEEQLRRVGSELDRRDEFETALELRSAVVLGRE